MSHHTGPTFAPPAEAARELERKVEHDAKKLLRDHVEFIETICTELRSIHRHLRENRELLMKISELSGKVDTLITLATDLKTNPPSSGTGVVTPPVDDPAVQALGDRIDAAIAVLQGTGGATPPVVTPPVVTPPVVTPPVVTPDPTNLNPIDPNAPVV